jgi:hypothetical protein
VHLNHVTTFGTIVGLTAAALYASGTPVCMNPAAAVWWPPRC